MASSDFVTSINKKYGKHTVQSLSDKVVEQVQSWPTGSLALDMATGIGGVPKGRIVEIFGPEMCGKTTLALNIIANAQKQGGKCLYVDTEFALDTTYTRALGVDTDALLVSQPEHAEMALDIVDEACRSGAIAVVVVDSVAGLVPKAELEGEVGASHVGLQARLMGQTLRKITGAAATTNTTVVFTNQLRHKVGVFFGSPETTPGGLALKFWTSMRIDLRPVETLKSGDTKVARSIKARIAKNKLAIPFREARFDIVFGRGIDTDAEIVDMALDCGVLSRSGSWISYNGEQLAQGRASVKAMLAENGSLRADLIARVLVEAAKGTSATKSDEQDDSIE